MSAQSGDVDGNRPQGEEALTSFFMAISMIGVSEIGDKTFLIAALMAMRHPRWLVFTAAAASLGVVTILSGLVGHSFVAVISDRYTHFLAGMLFLIFGYKLTLEGLEMSKDAGVDDELVEVEEEIAIRDMNVNNQHVENGGVLEEKNSKSTQTLKSIINPLSRKLCAVVSPFWIEIFCMIFLGEFGDRSQISIIAMASDSDYWYVIGGAVVGHMLCSCIAVVGGRYLATKISMRTVTLGGAFSFWIFAIHYIYQAFNMK